MRCTGAAWLLVAVSSIVLAGCSSADGIDGLVRSPGASPAPAYAGHVFRVCQARAAAAGARLASDLPTGPGLLEEDRTYVHFFEVESFADGHDDPLALWVCKVSTADADARFVTGWVTDLV